MAGETEDKGRRRRGNEHSAGKSTPPKHLPWATDHLNPFRNRLRKSSRKTTARTKRKMRSSWRSRRQRPKPPRTRKNKRGCQRPIRAGRQASACTPRYRSPPPVSVPSPTFNSQSIPWPKHKIHRSRSRNSRSRLRRRKRPPNAKRRTAAKQRA